MRIGKIERRKARAIRSEAIILFAIGPITFAIAAHTVEEIRDASGLRALAQGLGRVQKVKQILERDAKTYYVVDANAYLGMPSSHPTRVLLLRDASVALSVDSIDRMAQITVLHPLPRAFRGEERNWYRGLALIANQVVPVLNPAALLTAAELMNLRANLEPANKVFSAVEKGVASA